MMCFSNQTPSAVSCKATRSISLSRGNSSQGKGRQQQLAPAPLAIPGRSGVCDDGTWLGAKIVRLGHATLTGRGARHVRTAGSIDGRQGEGPGAAPPGGDRRACCRRRRGQLGAHRSRHHRRAAAAHDVSARAPPPPPSHRHRGVLESDTELGMEEVYVRMCHPAPDRHHLLHDMVVHPLGRRLLLAHLRPSRDTSLRPRFCHLHHLHLPRRRVHVVVAGRLPPGPRRVLHQEDAAGAPHLLGVQADQRRDIAGPELESLQGGGDHPAPQDRRVRAGIHHVHGGAARRRRAPRRPGPRLRLRAHQQPLPWGHLPHEPRRRHHPGPLRPGGHRNCSLRRHVGAKDHIGGGGSRWPQRPRPSIEGLLAHTCSNTSHLTLPPQSS